MKEIKIKLRYLVLLKLYACINIFKFLSTSVGQGWNGWLCEDTHFICPSELEGNHFLKKLLFGCPTANFGPLSSGQPHWLNVNHCILHFWPEGHWEPRSEVGSLSLAERLVRFWTGILPILIQRLDPLGHSPQRVMESWSDGLVSDGVIV